MLGDISAATNIYIITGLSSAYFYPQLLKRALIWGCFLEKYKNKNLCDDEITIKPKGCDFMNYNETVDKVMVLLKEKEVCLSCRKSHRDCYVSG